MLKYDIGIYSIKVNNDILGTIETHLVVILSANYFLVIKKTSGGTNSANS